MGAIFIARIRKFRFSTLRRLFSRHRIWLLRKCFHAFEKQQHMYNQRLAVGDIFRMKFKLVAWCFILLVCFPKAVSAEIYKCKQPNGSLTYQDHDCPAGSIGPTMESNSTSPVRTSQSLIRHQATDQAIGPSIGHHSESEDFEPAPEVRATSIDQRRLLDSALSELTPRNPKKINLFLLAVAGDDAQEVFHREANFVRKKFDREFDTRGHSLVLVNSSYTLKTDPMATKDNIRESLNGIAIRMDKQNDIMFLFLTSHGSREKEFILHQKGLDLQGLRSKELGAMLKETGIRWKVILISACYSGGFIDALKDDNTLVITAARNDRRSFGCAAQNDLTYFGRAFFKESLSDTRSFEDAFHKATSLVDKWETDYPQSQGTNSQAEHSLPQMVDPEAIRKYLKQWRRQLAIANGP